MTFGDWAADPTFLRAGLEADGGGACGVPGRDVILEAGPVYFGGGPEAFGGGARGARWAATGASGQAAAASAPAPAGARARARSSSRFCAWPRARPRRGGGTRVAGRPGRGGAGGAAGRGRAAAPVARTPTGNGHALGTLAHPAGGLGPPAGAPWRILARTAAEGRTRRREPRGGPQPRRGCTSV